MTVQTLKEDITGEQMQARQALKKAFSDAQKQSVINGTDKITMEEIDAEIAAYRREKREKSAAGNALELRLNLLLPMFHCQMRATAFFTTQHRQLRQS